MDIESGELRSSKVLLHFVGSPAVLVDFICSSTHSTGFQTLATITRVEVKVSAASCVKPFPHACEERLYNQTDRPHSSFTPSYDQKNYSIPDTQRSVCTNKNMLRTNAHTACSSIAGRSKPRLSADRRNGDVSGR